KATVYLLELGLGVIVVEVLYFLLRADPDNWWLAAAGFTTGLSVFLTYLAPVVFLPMFYKSNQLGEGRLRDGLVGLMSTAGFKADQVYEVNVSAKTRTAQAALAGLGSSRGIYLSDTLREGYTDREIKAVVAHELGHHVHKHVLKQTALQLLLIFAGLGFTHLMLHWSAVALGFDVREVSGLPVLAGTMGLFLIVASPLSNGYSRILEREADAYASAATGDPDSLRRALKKIGEQNLAVFDPHPVLEFVFYSHPPIARRLKQLAVLGRGSDGSKRARSEVVA
ncbi:MAG: M48 family metalloprotease, partial [Terriglobia bacterium]